MLPSARPVRDVLVQASPVRKTSWNGNETDTETCGSRCAVPRTPEARSSTATGVCEQRQPMTTYLAATHIGRYGLRTEDAMCR